MKVLVISDSHQRLDTLIRIYEKRNQMLLSVLETIAKMERSFPLYVQILSII